MPFFKERKRQEELRKREQMGETFWSRELKTTTRNKVSYAVEAAVNDGGSWRSDPRENARNMVLRDEGLATLAGANFALDDVHRAIGQAPVDLLMSLLEALAASFRDCTDTSYGDWTRDTKRFNDFQQDVNSAFRSDRFAAEFVEGEIIEFESREMHVSVVVPALQLLAGRADWSTVETAYQKAIREIDEDPSDAITDAGTALQEALTRSGAEGNALGPLAKSARKKGILAAHDSTLIDGIEKILHWVSADRSETGDAHKVGNPSREDAWFAVHIVGALILRLSSGENRPTR